jgi:hypothetical protein
VTFSPMCCAASESLTIVVSAQDEEESDTVEINATTMRRRSVFIRSEIGIT